MELKKHLDYRIAFLLIYFVGFLGYLAYALSPAEASSLPVDSHLIIPSIGLVTDVTRVELDDGYLPTPDMIVGSYTANNNKLFLFGHSSTVFKYLKDVQIGDTLLYGDEVFKVTSYDILKKSDVDMTKLLSGSDRGAVVLMTCAGENYGNGDSSHRLIVNAVLR